MFSEGQEKRLHPLTLRLFNPGGRKEIESILKTIGDREGKNRLIANLHGSSTMCTARVGGEGQVTAGPQMSRGKQKKGGRCPLGMPEEGSSETVSLDGEV